MRRGVMRVAHCLRAAGKYWLPTLYFAFSRMSQPYVTGAGEYHHLMVTSYRVDVNGFSTF
jgi:hypothetical protein